MDKVIVGEAVGSSPIDGMSDEDYAALVERVADGDGEAFARLFGSVADD